MTTECVCSGSGKGRLQAYDDGGSTESTSVGKPVGPLPPPPMAIIPTNHTQHKHGTRLDGRIFVLAMGGTHATPEIVLGWEEVNGIDVDLFRWNQVDEGNLIVDIEERYSLTVRFVVLRFGGQLDEGRRKRLAKFGR